MKGQVEETAAQEIKAERQFTLISRLKQWVHHRASKAKTFSLDTLLACPTCKKALTHVSADAFRCAACRVRYPVQKNAPVLLAESAKPE